MKKYLKWIFVLAVLLLLLGSKRFDTWLLGEARYDNPPLRAGNIKIPSARTIAWKDYSAFADSLYQNWASQPLGNWKEDGKTDVPRAILGRLLSKSKISEANAYLACLKPRGKVGSRWLLNPEGDYDFTLTPLTAILYLFDDKPELLFPATKKHLVDVLLTAQGGAFTDAVPCTLGKIKETENHLLMTEGSRYLKNQYLLNKGNKAIEYNNEMNGMENHVLGLLHEVTGIGLYEFNSVPYLGYTIAAILNLEAFGSEKVRSAARESLDYLNFCYALGSYRLKYYPPFRRRYEKARITSLSADYQTEYIKAWLSFHPDLNYYEQKGFGKNHGIIGACMPYRPADEIIDLIFNKSPGYFVKLGHGEDASPEIYTSGPGFLLSAGGVNRGKWSNIVTRPVCLFLNDDASDLSGIFHINGKGGDFMMWNNTGVYRDFACSNGMVFVPEKFKPSAEKGLWKIYSVGDSLSVAVHSSPGIGIIAIFINAIPAALVEKLQKFNKDVEQLKTQFRFPEGSLIEYEVNAPKNKWVVKAVDGIQQDRLFDKWPLVEGVYLGAQKADFKSNDYFKSGTIRLSNNNLQ